METLRDLHIYSILGEKPTLAIFFFFFLESFRKCNFKEKCKKRLLIAK